MGGTSPKMRNSGRVISRQKKFFIRRTKTGIKKLERKEEEFSIAIKEV